MNKDLQTSYDRVAKDYAENFRDELAHKPFDCKMLDWLTEKVGDVGIICDLSCCPGQIACYLSECGSGIFEPPSLYFCRETFSEI